MKSIDLSIATGKPIKIEETETNGSFGNIRLHLSKASVHAYFPSLDQGESFQGDVRITVKKKELLLALLERMLKEIEEL